MLTYEKVIEIFEDYLAVDHEEEVLRSRRGYVRVQWNGNSHYCENGCPIPDFSEKARNGGNKMRLLLKFYLHRLSWD